jgi:hypothetical protein
MTKKDSTVKPVFLVVIGSRVMMSRRFSFNRIILGSISIGQAAIMLNGESIPMETEAKLNRSAACSRDK